MVKACSGAWFRLDKKKYTERESNPCRLLSTWKASMITTSPSVCTILQTLHIINPVLTNNLQPTPQPRLITAHCSLQMQHFGKGALRVAKNYTKGYSDTQAKVRDATSNDPWGPSGTQMNEIAQLTYNQFRCRTHLPFYLSDSLPYFQNRLRGDYGNAG